MTSRFKALAMAGLLVPFLACGGHGRDARPQGQGARAEEAGTLTGKLADRGTSLPLAHVAVLAQREDRPQILAQTETQADGTYTLPRLPLGVPFRIVSQPVTGSLAYSPEVSAPVTLIQGATTGTVNLDFAKVDLPGAVEGTRPHDRGGFAAHTGVTLLQSRDLGQGRTLTVVLRTVQPGRGSFRLEALPPGDYLLRYSVPPFVNLPRPGRTRQPRATLLPPVMREVSLPVRVRAGETTHAVLPMPVRTEAREEAPAR